MVLRGISHFIYVYRCVPNDSGIILIIFGHIAISESLLKDEKKKKNIYKLF